MRWQWQWQWQKLEQEHGRLERELMVMSGPQEHDSYLIRLQLLSHHSKVAFCHQLRHASQ